MLHLKNAFLLLLPRSVDPSSCPSPTSSICGAVGQSKCHCGKMVLAEMEQYTLGDENNNVVVQGRRKLIATGGTGQVFHFHPEFLDKSEVSAKAPLGKCLALKVVDFVQFEESNVPNRDQTLRAVVQNEVKIMRHFAKFQTQNLIQSYLIKEANAGKMLVLLLEMGEMDFSQWLDERWRHWQRRWLESALNNLARGELAEEIHHELDRVFRELVQAVKEFNTAAIHLDLTPFNLLAVRSDGSPLSWRLIDFGAAKFMGRDQLANTCYEIDSPWISYRYSCPEILPPRFYETTEYCVKVSSKADIFSLGVVLAEMLLFTPQISSGRNPQQLVFAPRDHSRQHIFDVREAISRTPLEQLESAENDTNTVGRQAKLDTLRRLLHNNFPNYYKLLKALLAEDPKMRPSAIGIEQFLAGQCRLVGVVPEPELGEHHSMADLTMPECDTKGIGELEPIAV